MSVNIVASCGPMQFSAHAASIEKERPTSICTMAFARWPRPMPPHSTGTNGHQRPSARALPCSSATMSKYGRVPTCASAGSTWSSMNRATWARSTLTSSGISKSIMSCQILSVMAESVNMAGSDELVDIEALQVWLAGNVKGDPPLVVRADGGGDRGRQHAVRRALG